MKTQAQNRGKEVSVQLDGYKARMFLCSSILAKCERIKSAAKVLLEEIKTSQDDEKTADARVKDFLKDSIRCLLGEEAAAEVFDREQPEIANLTAVLCCLISCIGTGLGSEEYEEKLG